MSQTLNPVKPKRSLPSGNGSAHAEAIAPQRSVNGRRTDARSRQILIAITAFRDGDFSQRLPADWDGIDAQIASAFNQTIAHEARIAAEVACLSASVGKEGRLKQRMSLPGSLGGWATKIDSINTLSSLLAATWRVPCAHPTDRSRSPARDSQPAFGHHLA